MEFKIKTELFSVCEAAMTEVINLATGEKLYYNLPPAEAVIVAYLQAEKDWNTWQYQEKRLPVCWGRWTVNCGDFTALK